MQIRFPRLIRILACIFAIAAFILPSNFAIPAAVSANPGIMKWDTVSTPGSVANQWDILNQHGLGANTGQGSEILDLAAANDGKTLAAIVRTWIPAYNDTAPTVGGYLNLLRYSHDAGISWQRASFSQFGEAVFLNCFQVVFYPDDPYNVLVTMESFPGSGPKVLNLVGTFGSPATSAAGLLFDGTGLETNETIRCIDVSVDYGGKRDIGWGTVNGTNGGRWMVRSSSNWSSNQVQRNANGTPGNALGTATTSGIDYQAIKFSPTYSGDSSVALVYSCGPVVGGVPAANATYFNVAFLDINQSATLEYAYGAAGIEVKNPASAAGSSPNWSELNRADLELPSDFSGQSSSLRRAYISLDAYNHGAARPANCQDGIYRIDDTTTYVLMDTTSTADKAIYSIAYFGTYSSGKLLAGERMGRPCDAAVPTWFTDSPTTCPIPCWYPALKPTTGAANQGTCAIGSKNGIGAALVVWNADGSLGLVGTGSLPTTVYAGQAGYAGGGIEQPGTAVVTVLNKGLWYQMQGGVIAPFDPLATGVRGFDAVNNDESAFAISRNNGETWNQLSIIDTTIDWFNDVAIAPDCTTIYLASVNRNRAVAGMCNEFDSVWRATVNPNVAAPLEVMPPLGTYWERVFTHVTSGNCNVAQSDLPILRLVESCTDKKDGEIVGWAAENAAATTSGTGGVLAWSPDFGDYWAVVTPRAPVQDFVFETSTTIYTINLFGLVQRLPYTGTAWSTNLPSYDTTLYGAHTIAAIPDGKVLAGGSTAATYGASYSSNQGVTFTSLSTQFSGHGNEHVIFDVDFKNNQFMYLGDDTAGTVTGSVYRNTLPSYTRWTDNDMMSVANGASGIDWNTLLGKTGLDNPPHPVGIFGIVQAWTGASPIGTVPYGPALYAAHDLIEYSNSTDALPLSGSAVCRTLVSRAGMPKPGVQWDCLDVFAPLTTVGVMFTLEPSSLKYCGCCTLDTNTILYAIDDERGWTGATIATTTKRLMAAGDGRWNAGLTIPNQAATGPNISGAGYTPSLNYGMLWAYTDCLAKKGPVLKSPADKYLVGADPVTGRNQQIDLSWEQLCLSTGYELQVAKDQNFTLRINPEISSAGHIAAVTGSIYLDMDDTNMTSPAAWIAPGALPEAGAIYWWRIRTYKSATTQLAWSPWSAARTFTVKAGFIVTTPYYGVQLLSPNNGCQSCKTKPLAFSWSPWKEATKYQIDVAKDSEFKQLVVSATTTTTGYEYANALDYSTNYFWRVKALEVNGQNIPSDWSATFSFTTEAVPAIPAPPPATPAIPVWVWVLIAIGAVLVIVVLILIMKSRRRI